MEERVGDDGKGDCWVSQRPDWGNGAIHSLYSRHTAQTSKVGL